MADSVHKGVCDVCFSSWPSKAAMKRHRVCHGDLRKKKSSEEKPEAPYNDFEDELEPAVEPQPSPENDRMPVFTTVQHTTSPFEIITSDLGDEMMD